MKKELKKIYAPKGFQIRRITRLGNIPKGKTTLKIRFGKGKIIIPFPKTYILPGSSWKEYGDGQDSKGQYTSYERIK